MNKLIFSAAAALLALPGLACTGGGAEQRDRDRHHNVDHGSGRGARHSGSAMRSSSCRPRSAGQAQGHRAG